MSLYKVYPSSVCNIGNAIIYSEAVVSFRFSGAVTVSVRSLDEAKCLLDKTSLVRIASTSVLYGNDLFKISEVGVGLLPYTMEPPTLALSIGFHPSAVCP